MRHAKEIVERKIRIRKETR